MTSLTYRPDLDGLRSIAVYLVLLFHAGMVTMGGGFIGVDLFLVLSGFLVTGVILREVDERGRFGLGDFYARRVRRLLPAAVVVIVATAGFQLLVSSLPARMELVNDARASLLYVANWHFITESRDYFAADSAESSPFLHFWSLAIEEQFYIGYPLVVLLVLKLARRPMAVLGGLLATVTVISIGLQLWRATSDVSYAYYATETRVYQLAAGALLALGVRAAGAAVSRRLQVVGPWVAGAGLVALLAFASRWVDVTPSARGLLATLASLALIGGLWFAPRGAVARLLALPLPRYLGQVSYGTYLWHWPVLLALHKILDVRPLVAGLLGAVLATALASLSFSVLERPVRRSPRLAGRGWTVAAGGLTVSVLVAALVVAPVLETDRRPALAGAGAAETADPRAAALDRPLPPGLDLVEANDDRGPDTELCTRQRPDACVRVTGPGPHVLLLGDSQARAMVPAMDAIAREQDLTFSTAVLPGCPWQLGQVNLRGSDSGDETCRAAREDFFADVLPRMGVDVVLAVGLSRSDEFWADNLAGRDGPAGETQEELLLRTTVESAQAIVAAGPRLVIARSMFGTGGFGLEGFDPIECLSTARKLSDCAVLPPLERPVVDHVYGVLEIEVPGVHTVDLNPVICPAFPVCSPVIGRTVVWKDPDHVTTRILVDQRDEIWRRLEDSGVFS